MIENRLYQKALKIVLAYHEQTKQEAIEIAELKGFKVVRKYRSLEEVQPEDTIVCNNVHSASRKHLTKNKEYKVTRVKWGRFEIEVDSGIKKWYVDNNNHFDLI